MLRTSGELGIEKGTMTLVDESRQRVIKRHLARRKVSPHAHHACGGSAGNSVIAASQFGAPTYMSCLVANDADGDIYITDLEACGVSHGLKDQRPDGTTGKCLVLITPDAERSMNTFLAYRRRCRSQRLMILRLQMRNGFILRAILSLHQQATKRH